MSEESLRDRLRRLRRDPEREATPGQPASSSSGSVREQRLESRSTSYAASYRHGALSLEEAFAADPAAYSLLTGDESLAQLDARRAIYLDTETTGLAGGAGTTVFMIGLGTFAAVDESEGQRDAFVLWQGFLREPAEEAALLADVAERLRAADAIVSFFGKSFDRHRLEDKMRVHGIEPPFEGRPHLDLYHPCRRIASRSLPDGRLRTMECELSGVERDDDLPGSMAPAAWLDFLAGRPHQLEGVFDHNRDDVLSLVTLAAHLGRVLQESHADGSPLAGCARARARGIARAALERRQHELARHWLEQALEREREAGNDPRDLTFDRARLALKQGELDLAHQLFESLTRGGPDRWSVPGAIELAKLLEHRRRDPSSALESVRRAREFLDQHSESRERERLAKDLAHRRRRLEGKLRLDRPSRPL